MIKVNLPSGSKSKKQFHYVWRSHFHSSIRYNVCIVSNQLLNEQVRVKVNVWSFA